MDIYPDNTAAQFTTKLPQRIERGEGNGNMSLKEISTPQSFINIECGVYKFQVRSNTERLELMLPRGLYKTRKLLLLKLNRMAFKYNVAFHLLGQGSNRKLKVIVGNTHTLRPNRAISSILRLGRLEGDYPQGEYEANQYINLPRPLKVLNLCVYCNTLENVIVGDFTALLLRIVEVGLDPRKQLMLTVINTTLFVPIQKKSFDTINVCFMTETGKPAPFGTGKSHVVLELKKSGLLDSLV